MKLAILSDIHDALDSLSLALERASSCDVLLCCGDLCSPFVIHHLGKGFKGTIHIVFGNNYGDLYRMTQNSQAYSHLSLHGEMANLLVDGMRIGMNHYDSIAPHLASSGAFDLVCYGHNHQFHVSQVEQCHLINPGEIYGKLTGHSSMVVFDTQDRSAERVDLDLSAS